MLTTQTVNHHRRSIRLEGFDYSQAGAYFITLCTQNRVCLFSDVVDGEVRLRSYGRIVQAAWDDLPNHYAGVESDAFVIMPNHVHGVIVLTDVGAGLKPAPTTAGREHAWPEIVRAFKTFSARRINESRGTTGAQIRQRNYYEHIIRNEESLNRIHEYITNKPRQWAFDRENPTRAGSPPSGEEPCRTDRPVVLP